MAVPIAIGLLFQTLYYLVDLYFIAPLGGAAIAGVGAAGNASLFVVALTQVLGVGTVALIAHAAGRRDLAAARAIFGQSMVLSGVSFVILLAAGYAIANPYLRSVSADPATTAAGTAYLAWFLPALALQFPLVALASALRGTGVVRPTMVVQVLSVILNALLAPVLIAGWFTGRPMGVAGAGLASSIAVAAAVAALWLYARRREHSVAAGSHEWAPRPGLWRRMLGIGLPAGGEYLFLFINSAVVYWVIRDFGSPAQAGFGAGSRILNSVLLPAMAIALAAGPVAGQNFGAGRADRVRRTFVVTALMITAVMVPLTLLVRLDPEVPLRVFTNDPAVLAMGALFLQLYALNFVGQGLIFTCSSVFQGLGNTRPALLSSGGRLLIFTVPAIWLSTRPGFDIHQVWYLTIVTIGLQAVCSLLLLRMELGRRLPAREEPAAAASQAG